MEPSPYMPAWDALRRPIWMFDPESLRGVYANPAALALWGAASLAELVSRDFSDLSPAVRARVERLVQATRDGGDVNEHWTFYPQGRPTTVEATISTLALTDGRKVLLFEAAPAEVDADERRAAEALRHTSTLITLFDQSGGSIFLNPAAFAAYGSTDALFVNRFVDGAQGEAMLAKALLGEASAEVGLVRTRAGDRYHHLETRLVLDPVSGARSVLLNEIDVTARIEAERARTAAEQRAAMAEATETYLTDMSHELRTPLNAVIGFSNLLRTAGLAKEGASHVERIHKAGLDLLSVVNDMIGYSERDQAKSPPVQSQAEATPAPQSPAPRPHALRVLYVDDNENNRALVRAILNAQGMICETADDGAQGVEAARKGAWDVILMDVQMPVMDGVEATRAIRALPEPVSTTPIIAVTANTLDVQLAAYEAAGMDDIVPKPVDTVELLTKVIGWGENVRILDAPAAVA